MFEDRTYENIIAEVISAAPKGIDTRQGSIYYDAISGICIKIATYYADLSVAFDLVFVTTAVGEYLDQKGAEYGIYRNTATSSRYEYFHEGTTPNIGDRFFTEGIYFTLHNSDDFLYLEAENTGTDSNNIIPGTPAVPVSNIPGLTSSTFGELAEPGTNDENDEDYRQRIREKVGGPAENGNRQHYKTWCEEVSGVGRARIIPLWNGENTVKGIIIGADGMPAATAVVERVQDYIDPGEMGIGNGVANIGAHFTAVAATSLRIDFSLSVILSANTTIEKLVEDIKKELTAYLKSLALETPDNEPIVVRISSIGALIYATPSVIDYSNLMLNGTTSNIEVEETQVAILGEVDLIEVVR